MGYRDSPPKLGRDGGFLSADTRTAEAASIHREAREVLGCAVGQATEIGSRWKSAAAWLLLLLLRFYITFLSPFFGGACRFHPSCSKYAYEAIARHGARRGFALALNRLLRITEISKKQNIPKRFLEQILNDLKSAGIVESRRGVAGGYRLSKPPEQISLALVIRHIEGPLAPVSCVSEKFYARC